jgi:equilibrative nucleoside transporter 1/2/3
MWTLLKKLHWIAGAIFICFAVTMFYPVYTQQIHSVRPESSSPPLFKPASFIPLAFLFWNLGDLTGRLLTLVPHLSFTHYPKTVFVFSIVRVVFIPLYLLCNRSGDRGAIINSDAFYLFIVQLGFGITNGWLGSSCMMATAHYVDEAEREAAGGFMGLSLVAGLSTGSLLSFLPAKL